VDGRGPPKRPSPPSARAEERGPRLPYQAPHPSRLPRPVLDPVAQFGRRARDPRHSCRDTLRVPRFLVVRPSPLHERRNRSCVALVASIAAEKADADFGHVRRVATRTLDDRHGFARASPHERRVADLAQAHLISSKRIRLTRPPWRQEEREPGRAAGACPAGLGRTSARRASHPACERCGSFPRSRSCRSPSCP